MRHVGVVRDGMRFSRIYICFCLAVCVLLNGPVDAEGWCVGCCLSPNSDRVSPALWSMTAHMHTRCDNLQL